MDGGNVRMLIAIGFACFVQSARGQGNTDEFDRITLRQIQNTLSTIEKPPREIDGSNNDQNRVPPGTIIVYRTNAGNFGKALILVYGYNLTMRWTTYRPDGTLLKESEQTVLRGTWTFDFDTGIQGKGGTPDVWWQQKTRIDRAWTTRGNAQSAIYTGGMPAVP